MTVWKLPAEKVWTTPAAGSRGWIEAIALSPDGRKLAVARRADTVVLLWDVAAREEQAVLTGYNNSAWWLAFSPDGRIVATANEDRTIKLWDVMAGMDKTLRGHRFGVRFVSFARDGKTIASASDDGSIRLWDVAKAAELRTVHAHVGRVYVVRFNDLDETLVSAGEDQAIHIWDLLTGRRRFTLAGYTTPVHAIAVHPDGRTVVSAGFGGGIRVWQAASHRDVLETAEMSAKYNLDDTPAQLRTVLACWAFARGGRAENDEKTREVLRRGRDVLEKLAAESRLQEEQHAWIAHFENALHEPNTFSDRGPIACLPLPTETQEEKARRKEKLAVYLIENAQQLTQREEFGLARADLNRAAALISGLDGIDNCHRAECLAASADLYESEGDNTRAAADLDNAIKVLQRKKNAATEVDRRRCADLQSRRGLMLLSFGEFDSAIGSLNSAVDDLSDLCRTAPSFQVELQYATILSIRGYVFRSSRRTQDAVEDLDLALVQFRKLLAGPKRQEVECGFARALNERGLAFDPKDAAKAISLFSEAIDLQRKHLVTERPHLAASLINRSHARLQEKDSRAALEDADEAVAHLREVVVEEGAQQHAGLHGTALGIRGTISVISSTVTAGLDDLAAALKIFDEILKEQKESELAAQRLQILDNLAWVYASHTDNKYRDGQKALYFANRACELTAWKDAVHIEALAAGHAELGEFAEAVRLQTLATELAVPADRQEMMDRLALYQAGKPFRNRQ